MTLHYTDYRNVNYRNQSGSPFALDQTPEHDCYEDPEKGFSVFIVTHTSSTAPYYSARTTIRFYLDVPYTQRGYLPPVPLCFKKVVGKHPTIGVEEYEITMPDSATMGCKLQIEPRTPKHVLDDIVYSLYTLFNGCQVPKTVLQQIFMQTAANIPPFTQYIPSKKPQILPSPETHDPSKGIYQIYKVNAFTYDNKETGEHYQGNPAIVVMSHGDFPSKEDIKRICLLHDKPITTLIKEVKDESGKKIYDIRYYFPDGTEVSLCGHATVAATQLLKQLQKVKDGDKVEFRPNPKLLKETVSTTIHGDDISITLPSYKQEDLDIIENNDIIKSLLSCFFDDVPEDEKDFESFLKGKHITGFKYNPVLKDYIFIMSDAQHMHTCMMNNDRFSAFKKNQIDKDNNFRAAFFTAPIPKELGHDGIQTRCFVPSTDNPALCFEDLACGSFNSADEDIIQSLEEQSKLVKKEKMVNAYPLAVNTKDDIHGKSMGGFQRIRFHKQSHKTIELICQAKGQLLRKPTYKLPNIDPDTGLMVQLVPMQANLIEDLYRLWHVANSTDEHTRKQLFGDDVTISLEKLVQTHAKLTQHIQNGIGFYNIFIHDTNGHMKFAGIAGAQLIHNGKHITPDIQYALLPELKGREAHVYPKLVIQTLIEDLQKRGYETCSVHPAFDNFDAKEICKELGLSYAGNPDLNIARFIIDLQKDSQTTPTLTEQSTGMAYALWLSMKTYLDLAFQQINTRLVLPEAHHQGKLALKTLNTPFLTM